MLANATLTERSGDKPVSLAARHICILFRRFISFGDDVTMPYVHALEARGVKHVLVGGKTYVMKDGKLSLPELSGGTFTITNGGVFGSLLSTPIINPPQSAILGMHAIQKRPIAAPPDFDEVKIHPMMYVALSYDHRLIDGRESVSFLVRLKEYLEDPARLMLEI